MSTHRARGTVPQSSTEESEDSMKKFLVVVDMQKDFVDGALGTKEACAIVPAAVEKIREMPREALDEMGNRGITWVTENCGRQEADYDDTRTGSGGTPQRITTDGCEGRYLVGYLVHGMVSEHTAHGET